MCGVRRWKARQETECPLRDRDPTPWRERSQDQLTSLSWLKGGPGGPGGPCGPGGPRGPTPGSPWGQRMLVTLEGTAHDRGWGGPRTRSPKPQPRQTLTFSPLGPTSPGVPGKPCGPVSPWKTEAGSESGSESGRRHLCATTGSGAGGRRRGPRGPRGHARPRRTESACVEPTAASWPQSRSLPVACACAWVHTRVTGHARTQPGSATAPRHLRLLTPLTRLISHVGALPPAVPSRWSLEPIEGRAAVNVERPLTRTPSSGLSCPAAGAPPTPLLHAALRTVSLLLVASPAPRHGHPA